MKYTRDDLNKMGLGSVPREGWQACAWLLMLSQSPACFHIDDDPREIVDLSSDSDDPIFSQDAADHLRECLGACSELLGWDQVWDYYGDATYREKTMAKYVTFDTDNGKVAVVFGESAIHKDMARVVRDGEVSGAGFVGLKDGAAFPRGHSESLNLGPAEGDKEAIEALLGDAFNYVVFQKIVNYGPEPLPEAMILPRGIRHDRAAGPGLVSLRDDGCLLLGAGAARVDGDVEVLEDEPERMPCGPREEDCEAIWLTLSGWSAT